MTLCSSDLPTIKYPVGASLPSAYLTCRGADLATFDDLTLLVSDWSPDGPVVAVVGADQLTGGPESVVVDWDAGDLGALPVGSYGLTLIGTLAGEQQKWRGSLIITAAGIT